MAEKPTGDKTEKPTAKRRSKAREEGQVARSSEVGSAAALLATIAALAVPAPRLLHACGAIVVSGAPRAGPPDTVTAGGVQGLLPWAMRAFAGAVLPVVGAAMTA